MKECREGELSGNDKNLKPVTQPITRPLIRWYFLILPEQFYHLKARHAILCAFGAMLILTTTIIKQTPRTH